MTARPTRRAFAAAALAGTAAARAADDPPRPANLGLLLYSFGARARADARAGFAEPAAFAAFARARGASAVQLPLGAPAAAECGAVRKACEKLGVGIEGIVAPPKDGRADLDRFAAELVAARLCGAPVVRVVLLGGRRYEVFDAAADYAAFAKRAAEALERAEPVARRERVVLAVENHKDFRAEELADLLKRAASDWVGACVDTGNNVALLEDPVAAVAALAPFAKTVHLKDLGAEEYADGFRVAEVPLGRGCLDLKELVAVLRRGNPRVPFHLEMITRDPLAIPCLTDKYWATFGGVSGRELARALARVRKGAGKQPLPRVSDLPAKEQLEREEENVRASFAFARDRKLIP